MINLYNGDCMEAMKGMKDNQYDLAIVDPPYGINGGINDNRKTVNKSKKNSMRSFGLIEWDKEPPSINYFNELKRVSKDYIIWGGNYFNLHSYRTYIVWDKMTYIPTMSQIDLAVTSFNEPSKMVKINSNQENRIHINQKPVALYKWLLKNYAKEGDKILDTHGGSMSIAIACHDMKYDLDLWELDDDYYNAGVKRYNQHIRQLQLF